MEIKIPAVLSFSVVLSTTSLSGVIFDGVGSVVSLLLVLLRVRLLGYLSLTEVP